MTEPEPTFLCRYCTDHGFISKAQVRMKYGTGDTAWFCESCDLGRAMEAGHWLSKAWPMYGTRHVLNSNGLQAFKDYASKRGLHGHQLLVAVDELKKRYEKQSRRLEE